MLKSIKKTLALGAIFWDYLKELYSPLLRVFDHIYIYKAKISKLDLSLSSKIGISINNKFFFDFLHFVYFAKEGQE